MPAKKILEACLLSFTDDTGDDDGSDGSDMVMMMVMVTTVAATERSAAEVVINVCRAHGSRHDLICVPHSLWAMAVRVIPILQMRKLSHPGGPAACMESLRQ